MERLRKGIAGQMPRRGRATEVDAIPRGKLRAAASSFSPQTAPRSFPASKYASFLYERGFLRMVKNKADQDRKQAIKDLVNALQEDLSREYQAIIAYTVYSNVLKGAQWMSIAAELKKHAGEELQHALIIADQIDYLGGMPNATPRAVKLSDKPEEMCRFDLDNETETIAAYRKRVKQAEAVGHYALADQ